MSQLTDKQCDEFRRLPVSFNDMVRAIHQAGHAAARAEAEALLRRLKDCLEYGEDSTAMVALIDAYLAGGKT